MQLKFMCLAYQFIKVIIVSWQGEEQNWALLTALELSAGTLSVLLLKFGAVLSIICGYEWLFDGGFLVDAKTAVYCYRTIFSEVAKTT